MNHYNIVVDASPKYAMPEHISVEANNWYIAIGKAVKIYLKGDGKNHKGHKHLRSDFCIVKAWRIETLKEDAE